MTRCENIPGELRSLPQWVGVNSDNKIPMHVYANSTASSTDPRTWANFGTVREAVETGWHDYAGFVFNDNGIVGIDIDAGFDDEGFITPLAADIIGRCRSYTEKSRSGRGFHILLKGDLPFKGKNNLQGLEIYKAARYFIMTGDVLLYRTLEANQEAIDYIVETYFPETLREGSGETDGRIYSPVWEPPENGRVKLRPVYPRIPDGCRNVCLTSLAGMLHNLGWSKGQIYDELVYANTAACDPPLDRREIQGICNSVTKYKR